MYVLFIKQNFVFSALHESRQVGGMLSVHLENKDIMGFQIYNP